ncbi:MAG: response regulator [Deltaproteobacteria bacterium]|nr:response regulator [Deltaproteobacteria bacterium]
MAPFKLLIVEDSTLMRELMRVSLSRFVEIEIDEADDGLVAMKKLAEKKYDLVFADINMPVMDGIKLVKHIRSDKNNSELPVVIISTENDSEDISKIRQLGISAYLTKPVNGSEIIKVINDILGLKR